MSSSVENFIMDDMNDFVLNTPDEQRVHSQNIVNKELYRRGK